MAATKAKNGEARVLQVMWREADFHRPFVTITKTQIMQKAPCSLSTVKRAWRFLREEGSIKPVSNWEGGAKVATRFKLCIPGVNQTPSDDQITLMEEKRKRQAAWDYLRAKFGPEEALRLLGDPPPQDTKKGVQPDPKRGCKLNQKGGANRTPHPLVPQEPPCQPDGQTIERAALDARQGAPLGPQNTEEKAQFSKYLTSEDRSTALWMLELWRQEQSEDAE